VAEGRPPTEFGEEENLRWKAALPGKGLSTPIIVGERVFVTTAVSAEPEGEAPPEDGGRRGGRGGRGGLFGRGRSAPLTETDFLVLAFDRADGSVLWEEIARTQLPHQGTHRDGSFASPSIVSDGEHLFVSFGSYGLYAYDLEGEPIWEIDLGDMDITNSFGEGSSPVLWGDSLIVLWDHNGTSFLTALDKGTGKELWRTPREQGTNWSSPVLVPSGEGNEGPTQIVVASSRTIAYDAKTGKELWACGTDEAATDEADVRGGDRGGRGGRGGRSGRGGSRRGGIIATPALHDGVLVYSTGTRSGGSMHAVEIAEASGMKVHETDAHLWSRDRDAPRIPSPIVHEGILYVLKGSSGLLSAFSFADGEPHYTSERLDSIGDVWATPVIAGGHLYILGRDGTIEVVATGPELETVAVNRLEEDVFDASPAVAGDELFVRGRSHLYCFAATEE